MQQAFYPALRKKTLERWRKEAPEGFTFAIKAFQGVTHPPNSPTWRRSNVKPTKGVGILRPTSDVLHFWRLTLKEAEILEARFIIKQKEEEERKRKEKEALPKTY